MGMFDLERDEMLKQFERQREHHHLTYEKFRASLSHQDNLADEFPESFRFYDTDDGDSEPFDDGKIYEGYILSGPNFHYWIRKHGDNSYWIANDEFDMNCRNINDAIDMLYQYYLTDEDAKPSKAA